ncbi:hypothetical protein KAH94_06745 [bacterium]|nr:hypothetical protein [bacterium]
MKGKYKRSSAYCYNCDIGYPEVGKKCSVCGLRMIGSKIKQKVALLKILKEGEEDEC